MIRLAWHEEVAGKITEVIRTSIEAATSELMSVPMRDRISDSIAEIIAKNDPASAKIEGFLLQSIMDNSTVN